MCLWSKDWKVGRLWTGLVLHHFRYRKVSDFNYTYNEKYRQILARIYITIIITGNYITHSVLMD